MHTHAANRLTVILFFLAAVLGSVPTSADDTVDSALSAALLRAFNEDLDLKAELARLESQGYIRGPFQTISLGGICGVAGCDSSFLVAIVLSRVDASRPRLADINSSKTMLAQVALRAPDFTVVGVRRVQLVPVARINGTRKGRAE